MTGHEVFCWTESQKGLVKGAFYFGYPWFQGESTFFFFKQIFQQNHPLRTLSRFSSWRPLRRGLRNEASPPDFDAALGSAIAGVGAGIAVERVVAGGGEGGVGTGAGRPLPLHQSHARQV